MFEIRTYTLILNNAQFQEFQEYTKCYKTSYVTKVTELILKDIELEAYMIGEIPAMYFFIAIMELKRNGYKSLAQLLIDSGRNQNRNFDNEMKLKERQYIKIFTL